MAQIFATNFSGVLKQTTKGEVGPVSFGKFSKKV
jgi:hypothetical protein